MKQPMNRNAAAVMKPTLVTPPPQLETALTTSCGDVKVGQYPAEGRGRADAEQRDRGEARRVVQRVPQDFRGQRAVDQAAEQHRVQHGDHRRLGRREEAEDDAADDDARRQDRQDRLAAGGNELLQCRARIDRVVAALGVDVDRDHQRQAHQHAGDDAGQEQAADRHRNHAAPDDHQDRRRNDHAHHRRAGDQRDGERRVVALLFHRRDQHAADARGFGGRRAGDAGEQHRHQHADVAEAAGKVADQRARQADQLFGDARRVHQVRREHEKRNRQQQERVVRLQHLVQQQERRQPVVDEEDRHAGEPERECHRHAQDDQRGEDAEQDQRDFKRTHGARPGRA